MRHLPPLNALRVFEAAARHLSFTRAADELCVSQSAVSHQIKVLEEWLGTPLFQRHKREIQLNEEGRAYLPAVSAALNRLHGATRRLTDGDSDNLLCVLTAESFAANWLIRRLKGFRARHPDIDVRLVTHNRLDDFGNEVGEEGPPGVDIRIRYDSGRESGAHATRLLSEVFFPVCSPRLRDGGPALRHPQDLAHHVLLHDEMQVPWRTWLEAAGVGELDTWRGPRFSHSHMVIAAAVDGQGIALGRSVLVADELASGRLVRPFALEVPAEYGYYLVCPEILHEQPKVRAFRAWLQEEAARFHAPPDAEPKRPPATSRPAGRTSSQRTRRPPTQV